MRRARSIARPRNIISDAKKEVVVIMYRIGCPPPIVCMFSATSKLGILKAHLLECRTIIGDGSSQIPEPALVALTTRFTQARRRIYIGDIQQMEPHVWHP